MTKKQFNTVVDILERGDDLQLADNLEMVGYYNMQAIAVMVENMRLDNKPEAQITDCVVHDVAGFLENEEDFKPMCAKYQLEF